MTGTVRHVRGPGMPRTRRTGRVSNASAVWMVGLSFAALLLLGAQDLFTILVALAAINACSFLLFEEWVDRHRR